MPTVPSGATANHDTGRSREAAQITGKIALNRCFLNF